MQTQMNDKQHVAAGLTVVDQDGQAIASLPEGATCTYVSDAPTVATFTVGPDGINGDIASGTVGTANILGTLTLADGTVFSDTLTVVVVNSPVGGAHFTVGTPQDE